MTIPTAPLRAAWALVACVLAGCVPYLDGSIACGDGYVDKEAGEACDPLVPDSYEDACRDTPWPMGRASCDPQTCQIRNGPEDCAACGDGKVDPGEACDDAVPVLEVCPDGSPNVVCQGCELRYDLCPSCGNGVLDDGEECDWNAGGGLVNPVACTELESPFAKPFTSGAATRCNEDCRYDQSRCGFCGDGELDDMWVLPNNVVLLPEACDGEAADPERIEVFCREVCTGTVVGSTVFECNWSCSPDCGALVAPDPNDTGCCLARDEPCPSPSDPFPCCIELEKPGEERCGERFGPLGLGWYCN